VARLLRGRPAPDVVMGVVAVLAFALILYLGRHLTTFLYDEWNVVVNRQGWSIDTFLRPHNEHLVAAPVLAFKILFETVGAAPYWPYRVMIALVVVTIGVLVYVFAVPRLGRGGALVAGLMTVVVGAAGEDIIWPFQLTLDLPVLGGVALLLCLDRGTAKAEWWGAGFIVLALASSSIGLAVLAAGIVDVLLHPDRVTRALRLLAIPIVLYGLWYVNYNIAHFNRGELYTLPDYVLSAAGGALGALAGLGPAFYAPLVLVFVALIVYGWVRPALAPRRLVTAATLPLAFWVLLGIGRATGMQPTTSRYLLPGAVFAAVTIVESLNGVRFPRRAAAVAAVLVTFTGAADVIALRGHVHTQFDHFTSVVRVELAALSLAREAGPVSPLFHPDPGRSPDITTGPYFKAIDAIGEPITDPVATIAAATPAQRNDADHAFFAGLLVVPKASVAPPAVGSAPTVIAGAVRTTGSCVVVPGGTSAVLVVPAGGLAMRMARGKAPADLTMRRWGTLFTRTFGLDPGGWAVLRYAPDRDRTPIQIAITTPAAVRACTAR
jgi:hypothetical protein